MVTKDKIEHLTNFVTHDLTAKVECAEDLESFLAQTLKEQEAMKMNNFKKLYNCAAAVKVKSSIELQIGERKKKSRESRRYKSE